MSKMNEETKCHYGIVRALEDIEGTPIKVGHVGMVTADLPDGYSEGPIFAVWFRKEDVGEIPWFTFKGGGFKEKFELLEDE